MARSMAALAVLFIVCLFVCAISAVASSCVPNEPHVDCNFHGLFSPKWSGLSARASKLSTEWRAAVSATPAYSEGRLAGKGVVITATKLDLVNVPVLLDILQSEGCKLPVEIWYSGEVPTSHIEVLAASYSNKLVIKNVANYAREGDLQAITTSQGEHTFQVKPLAIINSDFEEVIFLDADNVPMSNPTTLFDSAEYQKTGALFWPDFWQTATENPIWPILGVAPQGWEQESGQMVISKKKAWAALNLAFFLAKDSSFQQMVNGDKEAFRLAFLATGTSFHMVETPVASTGSLKDGSFCGHTMVQHDVRGAPLFLHHTSLKHGAALTWEVLKAVPYLYSSFTVVPLAQMVINGTVFGCLDLVGPDVVVTHTPFPSFEQAYKDRLTMTDPYLKEASQMEFESILNEQSRRMLVNNATSTPTPTPNPTATTTATPTPKPTATPTTTPTATPTPKPTSTPTATP
ncbi:hypothetical protein KFL_012800010, partial [Klebsormidium nitens]